MKKGQIVEVDVTRLVAFVKSPLLFERNTSHAPSSDHALGEPIGRVVKMTTPRCRPVVPCPSGPNMTG
jgi:hypothetical protein